MSSVIGQTFQVKVAGRFQVIYDIPCFLKIVALSF